MNDLGETTLTRGLFTMALSMEQRVMIEYLKQQGRSIRQIARELGVNRQTVRRYLENPEKEKYCRRTPYGSQLDAYVDYVTGRLREYPDMSAEKLYREVRDKGFRGSYRAVAYYVSRVRPEKDQKAFLRYETGPGEQAQADWAQFGKINYYGRECELSCFIFVWGYSRRHYIEFTVSQDIHTLMRCHQQAFEYFNAVPRKILYDNMSQVVKSNVGGKVEYNEKFMDFALHYGFMPDACGVGRPHEKGKVERVVDYVRKSFFTGEQFSSLEELNARGLGWCTDIADQRIHGTTHERPIDRWEQEKNAVRPVPPAAYDARKVEHRIVHKDCYLNWEANCYSVPWQYAKKTVVVKATESVVQIYHNDRCIAEHRTCREKGKYIRNPNHLKGIPKAKDSRREKYREALSIFGEVGMRYFEEALRSGIANPYYHMSVVARLKETYSAGEVAQALEVALRFKALQSKTIVNLVRRHVPAHGLNHLERVLSIPGLEHSFQEVDERPLEFYDWVTGDGR